MKLGCWRVTISSTHQYIYSKSTMETPRRCIRSVQSKNKNTKKCHCRRSGFFPSRRTTLFQRLWDVYTTSCRRWNDVLCLLRSYETWKKNYTLFRCLDCCIWTILNAGLENKWPKNIFWVCGLAQVIFVITNLNYKLFTINDTVKAFDDFKNRQQKCMK